MPNPRIYSRGYLPHRSIPGATQFVTWRLHDALDADQWKEWKRIYAGDEHKTTLYRIVEQHLDEHRGEALLRPVPVGRLMMQKLIEGHGSAYDVLAAAVMPNHVHAVLRIAEHMSLGEVMKSIKGGSAFDINELLGRKGRLWQPDYFDRLIRSSDHLHRCIKYTHWNPVKARLCDDPAKYVNSTANPVYAEKFGLLSTD